MTTINTQAQQETNQLTGERLDAIQGLLNSIDGKLGYLEGGQYERAGRTKTLSRSITALGFQAPYIALNQDGLTAPG